VFNCGSDQQPVEVWLDDLTAGQYTDEGTLDTLWDGGCSTDGAVPLTISPLPGHVYQVIAVDTAQLGCDGNTDPQDVECQEMITSEFIGDANGYTRTDTVGE
jgi:hypothetical protein